MLLLARVGLVSSIPAVFRAAVVILAWLALWFSVLVATLERPRPSASQARIHATAAQRA